MLCTTDAKDLPGGSTNVNKNTSVIMVVETLALPVSSDTYYKSVISNDHVVTALLDTGCPPNLIKESCASKVEICSSHSDPKSLKGFVALLKAVVQFRLNAP